MSARKSTASPATQPKANKAPKPFWNRGLRSKTIGAVLDKMGVDRDEFEANYNAMARNSVLTEAEIQAVNEFFKNQDFAKLQEALGAKTMGKVTSILKRYAARS